MIYACFKNFNTIPSSSEELQERLYTKVHFSEDVVQTDWKLTLLV